MYIYIRAQTDKLWIIETILNAVADGTCCPRLERERKNDSDADNYRFESHRQNKYWKNIKGFHCI